MAVKIRLARLGCKNRTFYRIVAADSHTPRDDKHLQVVGFYDPLTAKGDARRLGLNVDLVKYWLSVGAQPIDTMHGILMRAGLISPPLMVVMEQKKGPADETSNLCIIYYGAEVNYPVKVTISTAFYVSSVLYLYA